jgi:hypothetical protein
MIKSNRRRSRSARAHSNGSPKPARYRRLLLRLERLEDRTLLSVTTEGVSPWIEQGPRPIINAGSVVSPNNPSTGAVQSIAVNPKNPRQIFLGTVNGGIWRTDNADPAQPTSTIWTPLTDQMPSLAMGDIAFSPLDSSYRTLFAGTGSFSSLGNTNGTGNAGGLPIGILRTTDGGINWTNFPVDPSGENLVKVVLPTSIDLNPGPPIQGIVLVGTVGGGGLYRSNDNGETFTLLSGAAGLPAGDVSQLIADPSLSTRFYAGIPNRGVYRGDFNSGAGVINWQPVNTGIFGIGKAGNIQLAAHSSSGDTVLFALLSGPNQGAYRSANSGESWTQLATPPSFVLPPPAGIYAPFERDLTNRTGNTIVADPTNDQIVYIATYGDPIGDTIFRYNPLAGVGGWDPIAGPGAMNGSAPHVDARDLAIQMIGGTTYLLDSCDGGLFFLPNPLDSAHNEWHGYLGDGPDGNGLGTVETHNVAWDSFSDIIIAGAQDNGVEMQQSTGNRIWMQILGGDGGSVQVDNVTLASSNQSIRYASSQYLGTKASLPGDFGRQVYDSMNMPVGKRIHLLPATGLPDFIAIDVTPIVLNATAPLAGQSTRVVVGGGGRNPIYESFDAGIATHPTWTAVPVGAGFRTASALAYGGHSGSFAHPEVLYAGSGHSVFVRSTGSGTLAVTTGAFPGADVQDIVLDPTDWQHAFVVSSTGVWETNNMGADWSNLTGNLENANLRTIIYLDLGATDAVLVGGDGGVFRMFTNNPGTWTNLGDNLPNAVTYDLHYDSSDDVLLAGTLGRGAWTIPNASTVIGGGSLLPRPDDCHSDGNFLSQDPNNRLRVYEAVDQQVSFQVFAADSNTASAGGTSRRDLDNHWLPGDVTSKITVAISGMTETVAISGTTEFEIKDASEEVRTGGREQVTFRFALTGDLAEILSDVEAGDVCAFTAK